MIVVVIDDIPKCGEAAVMVEATLVDFIHAPQRAQRSGTVTIIGRAFGLEVVNADLFGRVQIPTRFSEKCGYVAVGAARFIFENSFALLCSSAIEAPRRRRRR